ncbi:hypothetical protein DL240_10930 [Lujinxingia litoralis]|uniref:Peptidase C-terminal archaeal/bacterial domain-containing protein n=1 Tax=Lujinxingia litoralis TaxID=2211119 RepID=A0A328C8V7_9DELT|nr:PPC domain-containing protein [Lujinxingia litoralis]RAL22355.1 hypothetical protein DL240_10930 [Lujinxingia litoralis]
MYQPSGHPFAPRALAALSLTACISLTSACASSGPFLTDDLSTIKVESSTSGTLSASGNINATNGARYTTYAVNLKANQVLRLKANATGFSPVLTVFAPDFTPLASTLDQPAADGQARLITRAPAAGRYLVVLASQSAGAIGSFTLESSELAAQAEVSLPGSAAGYIFPGMSTHPVTGIPGAVFPLNLDEETLLNIRAHSMEFDTYLSIVDTRGNTVVAENDDSAIPGQGNPTDSGVLSVFPAGSYQIWVNSYQGQGQGAFTLDVQPQEMSVSESFSLGELYQGVYGLNPQVHGAAARPGFAYPFTLEEANTVKLQMEANTFDAYLYLLDSNGRVVAEDDDSAGALNPRIIQDLEAGDYTLVASSLAQRASGPFTLDAEIIVVDDRTSIAPGETIESYILPSDTGMTNRPGLGRTYTLEVTETTQVRIDLRSSSFDPYLVIQDQSGNLIEENDDANQSTNSSIQRQLTPGTYNILVTSYGGQGLGDFELQVMGSALSGQSV